MYSELVTAISSAGIFVEQTSSVACMVPGLINCIDRLDPWITEEYGRSGSASALVARGVRRIWRTRAVFPVDAPTFLESLLHLLIGNLGVKLLKMFPQVLRFVGVLPGATLDIAVVVREGCVAIPFRAVAHLKLSSSYQDLRTLCEIFLHLGFREIGGGGDPHIIQSSASWGLVFASQSGKSVAFPFVQSDLSEAFASVESEVGKAFFVMH